MYRIGVLVIRVNLTSAVTESKLMRFAPRFLTTPEAVVSAPAAPATSAAAADILAAAVHEKWESCNLGLRTKTASSCSSPPVFNETEVAGKTDARTGSWKAPYAGVARRESFFHLPELLVVFFIR